MKSLWFLFKVYAKRKKKLQETLTLRGHFGHKYLPAIFVSGKGETRVMH